LGIVPSSHFQPARWQAALLYYCFIVLQERQPPPQNFRRRTRASAHCHSQKSLAVLFHPSQVRFQFVAERHQAIDGDDNAFLFFERRYGNNELFNFTKV
jgi:hypothetical protein